MLPNDRASFKRARKRSSDPAPDHRFSCKSSLVACTVRGLLANRSTSASVRGWYGRFSAEPPNAEPEAAMTDDAVVFDFLARDPPDAVPIAMAVDRDPG
jgi:hypothetical protein